MTAYTEWVRSICDTEDAAAVALRARDRLGALHLWLTWQQRRGRVTPDDAAAALADVQAGIDAALLLLQATRAHRAGIEKPE